MMAVHYQSVKELARDWGRVPIELRRELRPRLRQAGEHVRNAVRQNAGFSSRIPGAVGLTVSFASRTGGVRVRVNSKRAPHARPLENLGKAGSFRHPVYGNRDVWVSQAAHPFFFPAVQANRDKVKGLVADAVRASFPGTGVAG